jgi:DNA-binding SARP family transcriptional activator
MQEIAGVAGGDHLVFGILGPIVVWGNDGEAITAPGNKLRALLGLLVVDANVIVTTDRLIDALWDGSPPPTARGTLHAYVSRLRALLRGREDVAALETLPAGYRLRVDPDRIDAFRFARLATDAAARLPDDPDGAHRTIEAALALWRGPALVGGIDIDQVAFHAASLEELRLASVETRMEAELARGRHAIAVGQLHELVQMYPLRERLHAQLMLALYRSGRQSEALRAYQTAHRVLAEEIGVVPGPELQVLERRIATQDPALLPESRSATDRPALPLPLLVERTARATALAGRDRELAVLDEHWTRVRRVGATLVSVSGSPGMGRTRLLAEFGRRVHAADGVARRRARRRRAAVSDRHGRARWFFAGSDGAARLAALGEQLESILPYTRRALRSMPTNRSMPCLPQYRLFGAVARAPEPRRRSTGALLLDDCQFIDHSSARSSSISWATGVSRRCSPGVRPGVASPNSRRGTSCSPVSTSTERAPRSTSAV